MGWQIPRVEYGPEWKPKSWLDLEVEGHPSFASSSHRESGGWWIGSAVCCCYLLLHDLKPLGGAAVGRVGAAGEQGQLNFKGNGYLVPV